MLVPTPPRPDAMAMDASVRAIVDRELARLFRTAVGLRLALAPFLVSVALTVAWVDPSPWRRSLMLGIALAAIVAAAITELRARRRGIDLAAIPLNVLVMAGYQAAMIIGTGGLVSPLLPAMVPLAVVAATVLGRRPATIAVLGSQVAMLLVLAFLQSMQVTPGIVMPVLHGSGGVQPVGVVVAALAMVLFIGAGGGLGVFVRGRMETLVQQALTANQVQIDSWRSWSRDLELMGGEIAHELKNPLASIKGLSALIARQQAPGKAAERMTVLQGEVARMQQILDEFLTFSRPIAPLSVDRLDARALCTRAAALNEGLARAAGVGLTVSGDPISLRADAHKLLQVLTNLLQNALVVAPRGTAVELRVRAEGGSRGSSVQADAGVVIDVIDRGPGVPADLQDRIFEAGVSSRPEGSGLGLTIARGIARQHGGKLDLLPASGGGTVARLWLPLEPPAPAAAAVPA
ncbi:MAG: HAMP domain-containing histidine kinase [Oligoflexia bacterium]|nr:HAMP domain-containing histidine kinase [Oligoflexia bacterium]